MQPDGQPANGVGSGGDGVHVGSGVAVMIGLVFVGINFVFCATSILVETLASSGIIDVVFVADFGSVMLQFPSGSTSVVVKCISVRVGMVFGVFVKIISVAFFVGSSFGVPALVWIESFDMD